MKISAATLVSTVDDDIQMPTGESGDKAISVGQIKGHSRSTLITVDPTSAVVLNFDSEAEPVFKLNATIGAIKTWSFTNATNAIRFDGSFTISGLYAQTFPASVKMNTAPLWDSVAKTWTPLEAGTYRISGVWDGTNWFITIENSIFV